MEQLSCAMNLYLQSVKPAPKRISCSSEIKFARSILLRFALASCLLLHCVRFVDYRQKFWLHQTKSDLMVSNENRWKNGCNVHKVMWNRVFESSEKYIQNNEEAKLKKILCWKGRIYILLHTILLFFVQLSIQVYFKKVLFLVYSHGIFWRLHYCAFADVQKKGESTSENAAFLK